MNWAWREARSWDESALDGVDPLGGVVVVLGVSWSLVRVGAGVALAEAVVEAASSTGSCFVYQIKHSKSSHPHKHKNRTTTHTLFPTLLNHTPHNLPNLLSPLLVALQPIQTRNLFPTTTHEIVLKQVCLYTLLTKRYTTARGTDRIFGETLAERTG